MWPLMNKIEGLILYKGWLVERSDILKNFWDKSILFVDILLFFFIFIILKKN